MSGFMTKMNKTSKVWSRCSFIYENKQSSILKLFYSTKSTFVKFLYMYVPSIKDVLLPLFIVVKNAHFFLLKMLK
jgi:hypothetical protein